MSASTDSCVKNIPRYSPGARPHLLFQVRYLVTPGGFDFRQLLPRLRQFLLQGFPLQQNDSPALNATQKAKPYSNLPLSTPLGEGGEGGGCPLGREP